VRRSVIAVAVAMFALAVAPFWAFADEPLSPTALEISNKLNCPVCEGQSVRDSNSQLARDMRRTVQERLDQGYTEEEVYDYFVDRYGVGILREPPRSGFFLTLWWAPVIGMAIGILVLGTFIAQRRKPVKSSASSGGASGPGGEQDDLSEYEAKILRDLEEDTYGGDRSGRR
jgi:cytochrome c-type biogenesis protein CcmH